MRRPPLLRRESPWRCPFGRAERREPHNRSVAGCPFTTGALNPRQCATFRLACRSREGLVPAGSIGRGLRAVVPQGLITAPLSREPADPRVRSAVTGEPSTEVLLMLKRTLAGLALVLAATAFNSAPASAFGWCGWGYGAAYSPRAYSYAPRSYYRPRARFYRPGYYGRAYYYRPSVRTYRRAYYRPFVGRAYRPAVARSFYRSNVRVAGPRTRAFYRSEVRRFGTGDRARFRGRTP
jgi:hypothetical protein